MNKIKNHPMKYSTLHRIFSVLFFIVCIFIVIYSHELGELRWFIWDVIIVMFLYSLIQGIYYITPWKIAIAVLVLSFSIELLQYFHFGTLMWWETSPVMMLIFGSIYDPMDLVAYTIGCMLIYVWDVYLSQKRYFSKIAP